GTMSSVRIMMAYETCVTHNMKQANKYYNLLKNLSKSEPLKGESDLELMLGMYIYESYFGVN
nr:hypothetical protein [Lachnospiraceae bacterium]